MHKCFLKFWCVTHGPVSQSSLSWSRRVRHVWEQALQGLLQDKPCKGNCNTSPARTTARQALQGQLQHQPCKGNCRTSPVRAIATPALQEQLQDKHDKGNCRTSPERARAGEAGGGSQPEGADGGGQLVGCPDHPPVTNWRAAAPGELACGSTLLALCSRSA